MNATCPLRALRDPPPPPDGAEPERHADSELAAGHGRPLRCRTCASVVSDTAAIFGPGGAPARQIFANPAGRIFEVLTLRRAVALLALGETTSEHTWFSGYGWRVVLCARCRTHLGWRFDALSGSEPAVFYGLLSVEIVEDG